MPHPDTQTAAAAETAADAVHTLTRLTRPDITTLRVADVYQLTATLTDLSSALPQTLQQLQRYLPASDAGRRSATALHHAGVAAAHLTLLLDHARQDLADTAEPDTA